MDSIAEYFTEEGDVLFMRGQERSQKKFVTYLIEESNKTFEQIADVAGVTVEFVASVHQQLGDSK